MKIVHPVFGELTFNYGWTKSIKLNIFKKEFSVEINIDADEDEVFDENQIKAFEFFFSDIQNRVTQAENSIVGYYNSIIDEVIDRGNPVITSVHPGKFTTVGHIILIVGKDNSGNYIINDPNSYNRTLKTWSYDELKTEIIAMWEFSK